MKSVLIVSYSYSPHITPRALRWSAIAEYLCRQGLSVDVICSWDPGSPRSETRNGVRVHRIGSAFIENCRTRLLGRTAFNIDADSENQRPVTRSEEESSGIGAAVKRLVKILHDVTWKKVYWPDYAVLWRRAALKRAKYLIVKNDYDAMITVAPPFTGHLVGLALKREFPSIRWIADSGDPFCFAEFSTMNSAWLYGRLNEYAEGRVFKLADGLSVTTMETASIYSGLFPYAKDKISVIPPLLNPDCQRFPKTKIKKSEDPILRLVYVGNFHHRLRDPTTYISTIQKAIAYRKELATRIELHFLGDATLVLECLGDFPMVGKLCRFHGRSSRYTVMEAMDAADVFVNIGNATSYQLPSKIIEYACFGKPILNFSSLARDSSVAFLSPYPLLHNVQGDGDEGEGKAVAEFLSIIGGRRVERAAVEKFIRPYTIDSVAGQYLSLLDSSLLREGREQSCPIVLSSSPGRRGTR